VKQFALFILVLVAGCSGKSSQSTEDDLLLQSVQALGAESAEASYSAELCSISRRHLDYMIAAGSISHDDYDTRNGSIESLGGTKSGEIVASNCGQKDAASAARQCAESWEKSSGHRALMRQTWTSACYQMQADTARCYFCIGLFANGI